MKELIQNLGTGETRVVEVPCPQCLRGNVLLATSSTLISGGTERMLVTFGKSNRPEKTRQQPDKVK